MPKLNTAEIATECRRTFAAIYRAAGIAVAPDRLEAAVAVAVSAIAVAANPYDETGRCLYCGTSALGAHHSDCVCYIGDVSP